MSRAARSAWTNLGDAWTNLGDAWTNLGDAWTNLGGDVDGADASA